MILVVGAGPVGLTAALELRRRGREVRIIDKRVNPSRRSKALGVNGRSLALLEASGVTENLLAAGERIDSVAFFEEEKLLGSLAFSELPPPYNYMVTLPQNRTEALLADRLQQTGVSIERGRALLRLHQDSRRVICDIENDEDGEERVEVDWVVGADGAHSLVRQMIQVSFLGPDYKRDWYMMDVRLDLEDGTRLQEGRVSLHLGRRGLLVAIPIGLGRFRLVSDEPEPLDFLPAQASLRDIFWRSNFRISHRLATSYQKGRVFLAGDAAHIHSPLGARGMNMGIEDAAVLAWLIEENKPNHYEAQRKPVASRVLRNVDRMTRMVAMGHPAARWLRAALIAGALGFAPLRRARAEFMLGRENPNVLPATPD